MKLYIETNFVMSIATGRDPQAENLLLSTFSKPAVREALREAGVYNYFSSAEAFLGWLQSQ